MDPNFMNALPLLVWAIFLGACILTMCIGVVLTYHWFRYAMNSGTALIASIVYTSVAVLLLSILLSATLSIHSL